MQTDLRLFQLISPSLPVGAFTYSQGLEWAVEAGWITDSESFEAWLTSQLKHSLVTLELPILKFLRKAVDTQDWKDFCTLAEELIAWRETKELRLEEQQRGAALARLLPNLGVEIPAAISESLSRSQLCGMALAASSWEIPQEKLAAGYLWSWLENAVMAGVKLIPLGQTQGQQLLNRMSSVLAESLNDADKILRCEMGSTTPALAIASSRHERQYTRLFRS